MANFQSLLNNEPIPVLVDFYADWCGPCRMMAPELQKLAGELHGKVKIIKVNVDKNPEAASKYGVQGIPTLILFEKGKQLWRTSGYQPAARISKSIEPYI